MLTKEWITQQGEELNDYVIQCRRDIHRHPEISGYEVITSKYIEEEIKKTGLPYEQIVLTKENFPEKDVKDTGWLVILETGKPGPRIALRADIDGLPVPEQDNNLAGPRVCKSEEEGKCHACGHDAHTAMLLGALKALSSKKDELMGTIFFVFEEGEENGRGVHDAMKALQAHGGIDVIWGIHVYADLESGKLCVEAGPRMAGAASVDLTVIGKGGHGSRPDMAANPVFCAASILTNVATAWVNQITAGETVTLGVTSIQGGEVGNVIPDTAHMIGSLRFFNDEEGHKAVEVFKKVAEHTAAMNNCSVEFAPGFQVVCPPVINDEHYSNLISSKLKEILPEGMVSPCEPWYASEAFNCYRTLGGWPSVFCHLGIKNKEYGSGAPHHNGYFDVDEGVLKYGLISTLEFVQAVEEEFANK